MLTLPPTSLAPLLPPASPRREFAPFLPYEDEDGYGADGTDEGVRAAVSRYCDRLVRSSCWGGHPELRALSCTVGVPIVVFQATHPPLVFRPSGAQSGGGAGAQLPPGGVFDTEFALRLSFHRHYLTLGEHYNSVFQVA